MVLSKFEIQEKGGMNMDERLMEFLELSTVHWDNLYRTATKPINIKIFVDDVGQKWDLKAMTGPCGGAIEFRNNAYRQYFFCRKHPHEGTLVNLHRNNSWHWLPPWKEEK
jgi:hypothetical protein